MAERPLLIFDASTLSGGLSGTGDRSGIFWVSLNLLKRFMSGGRFKIALYCDPAGISNAQKFFEKSFPEALQLEIVNKEQDNFFSRRKIYYKERKAVYKYSGRPVMKALCLCAAVFCEGLGILVNQFRRGWVKNIKNADIYFSTWRAAPKEFAREKKIKKFTMLYDTIPISCASLYKNKNVNFNRLVKSMNKNDFYFTDSESARLDFLKYVPAVDPQKIKTAYIAANMPYERTADRAVIEKVKEKYKIPADKKYFLSLSTLDPRKNTMFAVRCFLNFINKNNIHDLVFVLSGAYYGRFSEQIKKTLPANLLGLADKIIVTGYVEDNDLAALYSGAEIFVFPSLYEGFGMPVLEAMQCGAPVICSNTSSMPEVIGDAGIQINPEKEEELAAAFEKMYSDESFRQECARRGVERAKLFSWEKTSAFMTEEMLAAVKGR